MRVGQVGSLAALELKSGVKDSTTRITAGVSILLILLSAYKLFLK